MKVSRLMELLSRCSPDAEVRIYFPKEDFSDSVESVENHLGLHEELIFLYGFLITEEDVKTIWRVGNLQVIAKENDFMKTETTPLTK